MAVVWTSTDAANYRDRDCECNRGCACGCDWRRRRTDTIIRLGTVPVFMFKLFKCCLAAPDDRKPVTAAEMTADRGIEGSRQTGTGRMDGCGRVEESKTRVAVVVV